VSADEPLFEVSEVEIYSDGAFTTCTCADCDGDLRYERDDVLVCTGCGVQFSHYYDHTGENTLERIDVTEDGEIETTVVARVHDPADEDDGWRDVAGGVETDGGDAE